jgi:hypothetical protein
MHLITDSEIRGLKTVSRALIEANGGLESAAQVTRPNKTALALAYDQNAPDRFLTIDAVADLERAAGKPIVTSHLAALAHYRLVGMPGPSCCAVKAIASVFQNAGEVGSTFARGMEDGALSEQEWADLMNDLLVLAAATSEAIAGVRGHVL